MEGKDNILGGRVENKQLRFKIWTASFVLFFLLWFCFGCTYSTDKLKAGENEKTGAAQIGGVLQVHFIDVGQGDATLITCKDAAMLIDAGNNNMGTTVQNYLIKQGISKLDYVVGTHPDADHIGGLDVILYKFACDTFFMPDFVKDTKTYEEVVAVARGKQLTINHPEEGDCYALGDASFTILSPIMDMGECDANNSSIVLRLVYGDTSFLFSGDAEHEEEQLILDSGQILHADVYKVAHHGSAGANMEAYIDAVQPEYAVISCGKDNSYGHPHREVLRMLEKRGITTYRTDLQGTVVLSSDGIRINSSCINSNDFSDNIASANGKAHNFKGYILNTNTKKIHLSDCSSVKDILEQNRIQSNETLKVLMDQGYVPCKRCIDY